VKENDVTSQKAQILTNTDNSGSKFLQIHLGELSKN